MTRQVSIALHLARVMGKPPYCYNWCPHEDKEQWAECVLWAAMNGMAVSLSAIYSEASNQYWHTGISHDNTQSSIQAATLEAIARATSWEESK